MGRIAGVFVFALTIALVACQGELPVPVKCRDIPEGGCPRRGDACSDPACFALYVCKADGTWRLDHDCPPKPPVDAGIDAAVDVVDAGAIKDVDVDVPGASGGPGCESLVTPDCALATAAACTQSGSCCGCEDVFVCESGGWTLYGRCDNGNVIRE